MKVRKKMLIKVSEIDRKLIGLKVKFGGRELTIESLHFYKRGNVNIGFEYQGTDVGILHFEPDGVLDIYGSADPNEMPQVILDQREEDDHEEKQEVIV